ncbi:MAG TPA: hypothetical protein DCP90_04455 [Clostridiales bacterium]|nr:MAG: hypothetical protein A2Y22_06810 [Clostridiales bacterium GWD2_32_59]HAN09847.1 hypothetical protein [Clostridiales bacterium]
MFENVNTVIFDFDGTMVDSISVWKKMNFDYFKEFGVNLEEESINKLLNLTCSETAEYSTKNFNITLTTNQIRNFWIEKGIEYYDKYVLLKEGIREFLELLRKNNFKIGIATNNIRPITDYFLKKEDMLKNIDFICTMDDVQIRKPDPEMYFKVAKFLESDMTNCLVFEDSIVGLIAAKRAGMKVCAVLNGQSVDKIDELKVISDYQVSSFKDIKI